MTVDIALFGLIVSCSALSSYPVISSVVLLFELMYDVGVYVLHCD